MTSRFCSSSDQWRQLRRSRFDGLTEGLSCVTVVCLGRTSMGAHNVEAFSLPTAVPGLNSLVAPQMPCMRSYYFVHGSMFAVNEAFRIG